MINDLRCGGCNKKLALKLEGRLEIYCSRCKRFNVFNTSVYNSHKLIELEKRTVV